MVEAKKAMNYELKAHSYGGEEKRMRIKKKMEGDMLGRVAKYFKGSIRKNGGFFVKVIWLAH